MEVVYVLKNMQIGLVPSVAPTSISAGSQTSSSAGQGSSSNAGAAAGGAVAAVVVVAAVVSYYVWKKRSMTVTEEDDVDLETQKEPVGKKQRRKDAEKMEDSGGKKKKKKNKRADRDEVVKHTIDEDSNLELFYDDNQPISAIAKSPLSHNSSPRDLNNMSPKSTLSKSVSSTLPADATIDQIYGTDRLTAQSLQTFKSDRYAPNRKKDLKEFGVFEVSKQRFPLSESPSNDGGSVISRQGSTKSNREGGSAVITNPENSLKAIFDMVIRGETGTISPDILHSNRKLYSSDRSGSDSSLESRSDSVGKVSLHSLADKTGESTVTMQVDTANL